MNNKKGNDKNVKLFLCEQELCWLTIFKRIGIFRKLILIACIIGVVIGLVIVSGTPNEYTASTLVVHESTRRNSSLDMGGLTAMTSIDMKTTTKNAIYPPLYPAVINSTPFLIRLFDVEVREQKDTTTITLAQYMKERQKTPWWSTVTSAPFKLITWGKAQFREKDKEEKTPKKSDLFQLTPEEAGIAGAIASRITINIDVKKKAITLFVTMQDPLVAATVADTVRTHLQEYVTEYRTEKARRILEYYERLCKEVQAKYYAAQENYALYADANRNLTRLTSRAELARLKNEMELALATYNQTEQQVQASKARVEKVTPVYTVIQPAVVPLAPSTPRKILIFASCLLLTIAGCFGWVLFMKDFISKVKEKVAI